MGAINLSPIIAAWYDAQIEKDISIRGRLIWPLASGPQYDWECKDPSRR